MVKHYDQLTPEQRAAIMMMKAGDCWGRQIARTLHRSHPTISRELARYAAWQDRPAQTADAPSVYDARTGGVRARRQ